MKRMSLTHINYNLIAEKINACDIHYAYLIIFYCVPFMKYLNLEFYTFRNIIYGVTKANKKL